MPEKASRDIPGQRGLLHRLLADIDAHQRLARRPAIISLSKSKEWLLSLVWRPIIQVPKARYSLAAGDSAYGMHYANTLLLESTKGFDVSNHYGTGLSSLFKR